MAKQRHFSDETLESLREFGEAVRSIHNKLISEGTQSRGVHAASRQGASGQCFLPENEGPPVHCG